MWWASYTNYDQAQGEGEIWVRDVYDHLHGREFTMYVYSSGDNAGGFIYNDGDNSTVPYCAACDLSDPVMNDCYYCCQPTTELELAAVITDGGLEDPPALTEGLSFCEYESLDRSYRTDCSFIGCTWFAFAEGSRPTQRFATALKLILPIVGENERSRGYGWGVSHMPCLMVYPPSGPCPHEPLHSPL